MREYFADDCGNPVPFQPVKTAGDFRHGDFADAFCPAHVTHQFERAAHRIVGGLEVVALLGDEIEHSAGFDAVKDFAFGGPCGAIAGMLRLELCADAEAAVEFGHDSAADGEISADAVGEVIILRPFEKVAVFNVEMIALTILRFRSGIRRIGYSRCRLRILRGFLKLRKIH